MSIIQNALKINDGGKIYYVKSAHRHDFQGYKIGKYQGFIDGGKDYFRSSVIPEELKSFVEVFHLTTDSTKKQIREKLLWGHFENADGTGEFMYSPIKDLTKPHLKAILKLRGLDGVIRKTIKFWLKE